MKTLMMKIKLAAVAVVGIAATSAFAGTFLDSLNADPRKVDPSTATSVATGGDIVLHESDSTGDDYIFVFTDTSSAKAFTPAQDLRARVLVIGGGGSGAGNTQAAGGGGAGGFVEQAGMPLAAGTAYAVTVGKGGASANQNKGNSGGDSVFDTIIAYGGGCGGGYTAPPPQGASGGGGYHDGQAGATSSHPEQGCAGGNGLKGVNGGGGGGAGLPGKTPVKNEVGAEGGAGRPSLILGREQYFCGGGGGGYSSSGSNSQPPLGGKGGGGAGSLTGGEAGENGLGGGGGGKGGSGGNGGAGGDGIVIIRVRVPKMDTDGKYIARRPSMTTTKYTATGKPMIIIAAETGFSVTNGMQTEPGSYTSVATLDDGFKWDDGSTELIELKWELFSDYTPTSAFLESLAESPDRIAGSPYADGGDIVLYRGGNYFHIFAKPEKATAFKPKQDMNVRLLVVGGGGSGAGKTQCTGGGGAGGFVERTGVSLLSGIAYAVTVGKGGATAKGDAGNSGGNSQFDTIIAYGGGGGGGYNNNPKSGGSGGGGYHTNGSNAIGAQPTDPSQGNAGANGMNSVGGGGGGGAGGPGDVARNAAGATVYGGKHGGLGGDGKLSDILGFEQYFAGGGGGGGNGKGTEGYVRAPGGLGGGGSGALTDAVGVYGLCGEPGEDGLGAGGGGKGNNTADANTGGAGGSGIVIVRYFVWTEPAPLLRDPAVELVGGTRVVAKGAVSSHGVGASSTTLHLTLTPAAGEAKTKDCVVAETADETGIPFEFFVGNLQPDAQYDYELYGENDQGEKTAVVTGTLTTMAASLSATATGATITTVGYDKIVAFNTPGSYTLHIGGDGYAQILVVGGGGAGGSTVGCNEQGSCSGGGAGGVLYSEKVFLAPGDYPVVVGAGGVNATGSATEQRDNGHGKDSSFNAGAADAIIATGGGSGISWGAQSDEGKSGASGGGACRNNSAGSGIFGQGFAGGSPVNNWRACGGGGAGGVGGAAESKRGGNGGPGLVFSITGEDVWYGAGGGAGCHDTSESGGLGGINGGNGDNGLNKTAATSGLDGTGSGGGGAGKYSREAGAGGCGCVIIRYTDYSLLPEGTAPVISVEPVTNLKETSFVLPVSMVSMGEADHVTLTLALWDNAEDAANEVEETKQVKTLVEKWDGSRLVFTIDGLTPLATYYFRLVADGGSSELTAVGDVMTVTLSDLVWATGVYDPATWQSDPNNQLLRHCPLTDGSVGTVLAVSQLSDGSIANYPQCGSDFVWTWTFNTPIDVTALHIFSRWNDSGRDGIHINDVQVRYEGAGGFVSLGCGACDYDEDKVTQFAFLTRSGNAVIAQKVVAITVVGGAQDNNNTGYAEVEVIGTESYDDIPIWNYTTYTDVGWTAAEGNVLGSATLTSSPELGGAATELNDGDVTGAIEIKTGATLCWQLAEPTYLRELRFYSYHNDAGLDGIAIDDILVKTSHDGEWTSISECNPKFAPFSVGVNINGSNGCAPFNTGRIFVSLKRPDGLALFPESVTDVKIVFGVQDAGWTGNVRTKYAEIELVKLGAEPMIELVSLVKPDETKPKGLATVNVTWAGEGCETVTAAIWYREKGVEGDWQSAKSFENVIGMSALDFKLPGGKTYEVKVVATNANGKSAESETMEIEMPQGKSNFAIFFVMNEEEQTEGFETLEEALEAAQEVTASGYAPTIKVLEEPDAPVEIPGVGAVDASKEIVFVKEGGESVPLVQTSTAIMKEVVADGTPLTANTPKLRTFLTANEVSAYTNLPATAEAISEALTAVPTGDGANGLPLWKDYALGITPTTSVKAVADAAKDTDPNAITLSIPTIEPENASGDFTIKYQVVDRAGEQETLTADEPDKIKIPLATGIYDVKIVFEPKT